MTEMSRSASGAAVRLKPHVDKMQPDHGPTSGGQLITLTGTGLDSIVAIRIGGEEVLQLQPVGPTKISFMVPPNPPGTYPIVATLTDGTTVELGKYTYR